MSEALASVESPAQAQDDRTLHVVAFAAIVMVAIWGLAHVIDDSGDRRLMANGIQLAAALTAVAVAGRSIGPARGRSRRQLALLAMAPGAWAFGQLYWTLGEALVPGTSQFPSAADVGFVLVYPAVATAILSTPSTLHRASRLRMTLDGLVVALSLIFVTWAVALDAATDHLHRRSGAELLSMAYPIADILVITVAVVALVRAPPRWRAPILFAAAGFGLLLLADTAFAYLQTTTAYSTGSIVDLGWILGWLAVAAAAACVPAVDPEERPGPEVPSRMARLVPIVALGAVAALAVVNYLQGRPFTSDAVLWWTGLALFGINVARTVAARGEIDVIVKELALSVAASEELLAEHRLALEGAELGIWRWHAATSTIEWSTELEAIYGLAPQSFGGAPEDFEALLIPEEIEHVRSMVAHCARSDRGVVFEHRICRPDGTVGWVQNRGRVQRTSGGAVVGIIGIAFDTTALHDAERALRTRAQQSAALAELSQRSLAFSTIAEAMEDAVATLAATLGVEFSKVLELDADSSSLRLVAGCGWKPGLVGLATVGSGTDSQAGFTLGCDEPAVVVEDLRLETRFQGPALLTDHGVRSGVSTIIRTAAGSWGVLGAHTASERHFSADDVNFVRSVAATVGAAVDRNVMTEELTHRSLHDELTGLPNRALLQDRLSVAIAAARRAEHYVAVLHIGLDRFTLVNESFGHGAGDGALVEVAQRISRLCGSTDTAARWGGDEFVLAATVTDKHAAVELAAQVLAAVSAPLLIQNPLEELFLSTSIGLAVANGRGDAASMLRDAGVAARRASELGGRRYELFDDKLRTGTIERLQTEREIRHGLTDGHFEAHYQPIVRTSDGALVAVEALARWRHPTRGLLLPGDFLQAAETAGLVGELGAQILAQAAADAVRWNLPGQPLLKVSVNVATSELVPALVDILRRVLAATGARPEMLCVEILETALADLAEPAAILTELRALGVCIYIDDFGTGHSTLARLARLPVDGLKVDRAFVTDITDRAADRAVAAGIIQLGRALGLAITAEGVETAGQLAALTELGCEHVQGWLFARALPSSDIDELVARAEPAFGPIVSDARSS